MSLTSLLAKDQEVKELFKSIPNVKQLFKSYFGDRQPFEKSEQVNPLLANSQPQSVGTAYDIFLNAYIQRSNKVVIDSEIRGLLVGALISIENYISDKLHCELIKVIEASQEVITCYIKGIKIPKNDMRIFASSLLTIANFTLYARSGKIFNFCDIHEHSIDDLLQLIQYTESRNKYLKINENYISNPTFGLNSALIGGADGDLILNNVLIDVKTTKTFGYSTPYLRQLIGYYVLNNYNKYDLINEEKHSFNKIGLFYPRQDQFVYLEIKDLEKIFDLDDFANKFFNIVKRR